MSLLSALQRFCLYLYSCVSQLYGPAFTFFVLIVSATLLLGGCDTSSIPEPGSSTEVSASPTTNASPTNPQIVWQDSFDGTSLDTDEWLYRDLGPRKGAENVQDAVEVSNGTLKIYGYSDLNDTVADEHNPSVQTPHKMGMIATKKLFKYGRIEADIVRSDMQSGCYGDFWLQALDMTSASAPGEEEFYGSEMDIMEHRADKLYNAHFGLHWIGYGSETEPGPDAHYNRGKEAPGVMNVTSQSSDPIENNLGDNQTGPMEYRMDWTPDELRFYVDDVKYWTVKDADNGGNVEDSRLPGPYHVSDIEEEIILSIETHYGSNRGFAGYTPDDYGTKGAATNCVLEVDEVRVFDLGNTEIKSRGGGGGGGTTPPVISAPTDLVATVSGGIVSLTWTADDDADEYFVYEKTPNDSDHLYLGRTNTVVNSFDIGNRTDGTYEYIVRPVSGGESLEDSNIAEVVVNSDGGGGGSSGSDYKEVRPAEGEAVDDLAATVNGNQVTLNWTNNKPYDVYSIYRSPDVNEANFEYITYTHNLTKTITLSEGIHVLAIRRKKDGITDQNYSNMIEVTVGNPDGDPGGTDGIISAPTNLTATANGSQVTLAWEGDPDAYEYFAYWYDSSKGDWEYIARTFENVTTLDVGTFGDGIHQFMVRGVDSNRNSKEDSNIAEVTIGDSDTGDGVISAPYITAERSGDRVTLTWDTDPDATESYIYDMSLSAPYIGRTTTNTGTYTTDPLSSGVHEFMVRNVDASGDSKENSNMVTVTIP